MYVKTRMDEGTYKKGSLPDATPVIVSMEHAPIPCSVVLNSAGAARKIEVSFDDGSNWYSVLLDYSNTFQQVVCLQMPVSFVRFTGSNAGTDSYLIR